MRNKLKKDGTKLIVDKDRKYEPEIGDVKMRNSEQSKDKLNGQSSCANYKWSELIEIMNELSDYRAHFVVLLARSYLKLERAGK